MDKIQLQQLIAAKIAGQGNQIDLGGALADILSAVAGAAPTFGEGYTNDTIFPDCATLFKAILSSGMVTVTAVTPVSE